MTDRATVHPILPHDRGAAAVAARVLTCLDDLVERMGHAYRVEISEYAALTPDEMEGQVLRVSRALVERFFSTVLEGGDLPTEPVPEVEESGRIRLAMGVPLESVLHAYRVAGRITWDAVVAATKEGEEHVLAELAARWIELVDRASSWVAESYLAASHEQLRRVDARRRALLDALLSATDAAEVAAVSLRFSATLAPAYVPVLLEGDGVAARVDRIIAAAPDATVGGERGGRILLLVPAPYEDVAAVHRAARPALVAWGTPAAPGPALLAEVGHVEAQLAAAEAAGLVDTAVGPEDLLVEQLLAGNDRVADALRRRVHSALAARDPGGLLSRTLATYLSCGSVPDTARREFVHANTVAYRLKRVRVLTGLDPRVPAQAAVLVLALAVPPRPGGAP